MTFRLTCSAYVCVCVCVVNVSTLNTQSLLISTLFPSLKSLSPYLFLSPMTSKTDFFNRYPELNTIAVYIISFGTNFFSANCEAVSSIYFHGSS